MPCNLGTWGIQCLSAGAQMRTVGGFNESLNSAGVPRQGGRSSRNPLVRASEFFWAVLNTFSSSKRLTASLRILDQRSLT